jgi:hypothetical protein
MWFELKTRHLEKSGFFILLKACPTGFLNGKTASPKFQFSSPGRRTWAIFNPWKWSTICWLKWKWDELCSNMLKERTTTLRVKITTVVRIAKENSQALVSLKKYMPPPLPYFKVNICPLPLPHFASIFFSYLWSFRWPNYIVTLLRYFSFRLPHLNISTGPPSNKLDKNSQRTWLNKSYLKEVLMTKHPNLRIQIKNSKYRNSHLKKVNTLGR